MAQPSWSFLPGTLPEPQDDGACSHLTNTSFPSLSLPSTSSSSFHHINPSRLPGLTILFCYPRTAAPHETVPDTWNAIPGARGCTPQACSFRDLRRELEAVGVSRVLGVSTQDVEYQAELKERMHLPYELLSDEKLELARALKLPTFEFDGMTLIKRLSLAIEDGKIVKVWYPVFPPDQSAAECLAWAKARAKQTTG